MSKARLDFRRMLLRLPHNRQDYAAVRIVSQIAGLLSTNLVGTYVEDLNVHELSLYPNAREFRGGSWQPFSAQQLARDIVLATKEAERLFFECARRHKSNPSFRLAKDPFISQETLAEDIIVVIEPKNPIERATYQFNEFLRAAFGSASSILLMPGRTRNASGPIISVASDPNDPSIETALDIAASTGKRMILLSPRISNELRLSAQERAQSTGVDLSMGEAAFRDEEILLPPCVGGSLLIMNRKFAADPPRSLQVPTLLVCERLGTRPLDLK